MFKLTVVTPERRLVMEQEIEQVTVPAFRGELNILPGHVPLITTLGTGIIRWQLKGDSTVHKAVISWGYCQVNPNGVDILADLLELPAEIDLDQAKETLVKGEKRLAGEFLDDQTWDEVQRQISRARAEFELSKTH
jgi:F-type H+-transporting ATPase subunit epsilon